MAVDRYLTCVALSLLLVGTTRLTESYQNSQATVRLVDGTSERNGRVELYWDNQWKAVCDSWWDEAEAITVCRELGYLNSNGWAIAVNHSYFGDAQEIHQLKQWKCRSSDTCVAYCSKTMALSPCSPSETAGVYCQGADNCEDGEVRLMNGSTPSHYEGRVEICFNGVWGTICSDNWDSREATVVCSQLGISATQLIDIAVSSSELYGEGEGPIILDRISCGESDTRLADCARFYRKPGMVGDHCTHSKDAGVICRRSCICNDGEIRLNGERSQTEGIVEICFGGVWGTICHDGWDESDAKVVCQQLGYSQGYVMMNMEYDREAHTIRHLSHVSCTGNESRLADCSHEGIGVHTCGENSNENAAVICIGLHSTSPTTSTQATCYKESSIVISYSTITTLSVTVSTITMTTPLSTPLYSATIKVTTTSKIIIGSVCGSVVLITLAIAVPIIIYSVKMRRKQQWISQQQARESDSNQQQQLELEVDDDIIPKEEITTSSSHNDDNELEHNFCNPLYAKVGQRGRTANDTICNNRGYCEVRMSIIKESDDDYDTINRD